MEKYFFAIDVGGTDIKGGIVDENNNLTFRAQIKTDLSNFTLAENINLIIKTLKQVSGLDVNNSSGVGIGIPGEIDSQNGIVCISQNLKIYDYDILSELKKSIFVPIKIANDANLAALGEFKFGAAKNFKNFIVLTLGTGIGGDFFINGKPYSSISPFSGEFAHIKVFGGLNKKCACGEYDCYELYGSTRALVCQTRDAMLANRKSKIWSKYNENTVCGKTVFEFLKKDKVADAVFEKYISYLGSGVVSLVNLLMPEAVIICGAISAEGKTLTAPLEKYVNSHIYAKNIKHCHVKILPAALGSNAALYGAKSLFDLEV